jgi:hypothetical protein
MDTGLQAYGTGILLEVTVMMQTDRPETIAVILIPLDDADDDETSTG